MHVELQCRGKKVPIATSNNNKAKLRCNPNEFIIYFEATRLATESFTQRSKLNADMQTWQGFTSHVT